MATLTCSPQPPIGYTDKQASAGAVKPVTIAWDTGNQWDKGSVWSKRNNEPEEQFDNPFNLLERVKSYNNLKFGDTVKFSLRSGAGNTLAELVVNTSKTLWLPPGWDKLEFDHQTIRILDVIPYADHVLLRWRTTKPDACWVLLESPPRIEPTSDGTLHEAGFIGLKHNTHYRFKISTRTGEAKYEGHFWTGKRSATISFDSVHVRTDGDPGIKGAGEFHFEFGVGDVETRQKLAPWGSWGKGDIDAGSAIQVNHSVNLTRAPRELWLAATAIEYDDWEPGPFFAKYDAYPGPPESHIKDEGSGASAYVTRIFDLDALVADHVASMSPSASMLSVDIPVVLSTPSWAIAYDVHGRILLTVTRGWWTSDVAVQLIAEHAKTLRHSSKNIKWSAAVGGAKGLARFVVTADGDVHMKGALSSRRPFDVALNGRRVRDGLVATAVDDYIHLLAIDDRGTLISTIVDPWTAPDGRWRELGLADVEMVTAAPAPGAVDVVAIAAGDAIVYGRMTLDGEQTGWDGIGEGADQLLALSHPVFGLTVVASRRGTDIRIARRDSDGRWMEWRSLGTLPPSTIAAHWEDDDTLILTAVDDDRQIRLLTWNDYPAPDGVQDWVVVGHLADVAYHRAMANYDPTIAPDADMSELPATEVGLAGR
jgi:hypothetical protein